MLIQPIVSCRFPSKRTNLFSCPSCSDCELVSGQVAWQIRPFSCTDQSQEFYVNPRSRNTPTVSLQSPLADIFHTENYLDLYF